MEKSIDKVHCPECKTGVLLKRDLPVESYIFGNEKEYECDNCSTEFDSVTWYGERDKKPLPALKKGFVRECLDDSGHIFEYRKDKIAYLNENGQMEYSRIYDKYGRVSSRFIILDFSCYNGLPNIQK